MAKAVSAYPARSPRKPAGVVVRRVDTNSGLIRSRSGEEEFFRRGVMPPKDRFWRRERVEVIE